MAGTALTVDLNARLVNFQKGMDQANRYLDKLGRNAQQTNAQLKSLTAGASSLVKSLAALAGVSFSAQAVRGVTEFSDALVNAAERADVSVEELQALRNEAEKTGLSFQGTDTALQRFSRRVADARQGTGTLLPVLKQYGIELSNSDGTLRRNVEILDDYRQALADSANQGEENRIAVAGLDSEGVKLGQTLANLNGTIQDTTASQLELGRVMEEESVRAAAELETRFTELTQRAKTSFRSLVVDVVDGWSTVISALSADVSLTSFFSEPLGINDELNEASQRIADAKTDLADYRNGWFSTQQGIAIRERDLLILQNRRRALTKEVASDRAEERDRLSEVEQVQQRIVQTTKEAAAAEKEKLAAQREQERALQSIQDRLAKIGELQGADAVQMGEELDLGDVYLRMRDVTGLLSGGETEQAQQGIENMAAALEKLSKDASGLDLVSIKQARDQLAQLATEAFGPTAEQKVKVSTETDLKETVTVTLAEVQAFLLANPLQIPATIGLESALATAVDTEGFRE